MAGCFRGAFMGRDAAGGALTGNGSISMSATSWGERSPTGSGGVGGVAFEGGAVGVLDGAQAGGDAGFAGGDGLAVAAAVGAFGQAVADVLDFADVGFAFVGVRGDGEQGGVGGGGVQDEADGLALGVAAGQRDDPGAVGFWPGWLGVDRGLPDPLAGGGEDP